jgi:Glycosyltransferase family 87/WD40-like Beta Propeller Repeat
MQEHRLICWCERSALLVLVLYLCSHTMPRAWGSLVTDFPNYYTAARLAHEGYDTSRMYEWRWLERQKDNRAIAVRVIGLLPITPFSTLVFLPLASVAPLAAKHVWIVLTMLLLIPIAIVLRSMTGLSCQRIALIFALSFPLYRNLEFGQFYVALLLLIVAACWSYLQGFGRSAGVLVAIAAACKVFPLLFFVFFLQRRAWRSLTWGMAAGLACAAISIGVFGRNAHYTYLQEILPWTLHGEGMPPYGANASISGLLHTLFLSEPQWNPHPWHYSPLCYALLLHTLQTVVFAPAILLIRRDDCTRMRILQEWSALLTASLAVSTIPALYNFVLMALPMCVLTATLLEKKRYGWMAASLIAYVGMGLPMPAQHGQTGLAIPLYFIRLPFVLGLLAGLYKIMWNDDARTLRRRDWTRYAWVAAMLIATGFSVQATFLRESAVRQEFAYRLPLQAEGFLNADPRPVGTGVRYIAFTLDGYHLMTEEGEKRGSDLTYDASEDDLSFGSLPGHLWVERGKAPLSEIVDLQVNSQSVVKDARDPMSSIDGKYFAFVRDDHGRGRLMLQDGTLRESELTLLSMNVYEASFLSPNTYAFSATQGHQFPQIYLTDATHANTPLHLGESRYPALSPDGRWMAFSRFERGAWNLWIRDQKSGATQRIGNIPCNEIQPSWEKDSKTLLYTTDCGRSLWFTAVARRQVIP